MDNFLWARQIVDQLIRQGVTYFCLSPGSRSAPLAIAIAEHPLAQALIHFDERGAAFHALGYAKASGKAAAVITTSGTATANLFPAVMEASLARVPLIFITADRPHELRQVGANQTADQVKLFEGYVRWQTDLPCLDIGLPERFIATTIAHAVYKSKEGPVHLNCPLRESPLSAPSFAEPLQPTYYEESFTCLQSSTIEKWAALLSAEPEGIIVLGTLPHSVCFKPLIDLAESLQWPIFSDILSQLRSQGEIPYHMPTCSIDPSLKPKIVLHLGDRMVAALPNAPLYCHVADHADLQDPNHQVTHRIRCNPLYLCKQLVEKISKRPPSTWHAAWMEKKAHIESTSKKFFGEKTSLTEVKIVKELSRIFSEEQALFLSNSLPIRAANRHFFPKHKTGPIFANRGVSGIDGNIATAIGIAQGAKLPTLAILGDLAALHDINSLSQLKTAKHPVIFLIFNNGGGGIFSFLPIKEQTPHFEQYFAAAHTLSFEHAARLFNLPYYAPQTLEELFSTLEKRSSCLIEVTTSREENVIIHQELQDALSCMDRVGNVPRH